MTDTASLLASLPKAASDSILAAIAKTDFRETRPNMVEALDAVSFPQFEQDEDGMWQYEVVLAAKLTPAQRALAMLIALHPHLPYNPYALPDRAHLRRWLGVDPPERLERRIDGVPLWFALQSEPNILRRFSIAERLELAAEIADGAYALNWRVRDPWPAPEELTGEGVEWARRRANELADKEGRNGQLHLFLTLVRAKSPLDPRWVRLAPLQLAWLEKQPDAVRECVAAVASDHRTEMITPWLTSELPHRWCAYLATVARLHPDPALVDKLFVNYKSIMEWPKADERARLDALGRELPALAPAISKNLARVKVAKLAFTRVKVGVKQLTPLQKKQLAPLVKEYGTAGGVNDAVAFYEVRDDKGAHKYDAIVLGGTEGVVFSAGTTKRVAVIAQGGAEAKSVSLSIGLEHALAALR